MSKRKYFQMHLSTAAVLMLVAGVLLWANVRERTFDPKGEIYLRYADFGCPFSYHHQKYRPFNMNGSIHRGVYREHRATLKAAYNALIALAILLSVWQVCEWRIRRSSSQKSP